MSKVLAEYTSSSNPGKKYQIIQPNDETKPPYCTCWQWKRERTCKHLEDYRISKTDPIEKAIEDGVKAIKR